MASWLPNWPDWLDTPIPGVSLSAGGLLALADLSTVAQRTAITGGSSWLDSLLLAPGLHYQQCVESSGSRGNTSTTGPVGAFCDEDEHVEECDHTGTPVRRFRIRNTATKMYIRRIARPGEIVTLDVGAALPAKRMGMGPKYKMPGSDSGSGIHAIDWAVDSAAAENGGEKNGKEDDCHNGHRGSVSHFLYLASPVLTIIALACVVLVRDWWAFGQLGGLMLSRILNIWIIKQRTKGQQDQQPTVFSEASLTAYNVSLPPNHPDETPTSVRLRGTPSDLRAITSSSWLRAKTHGQGYLEATAKLVVYLVAAFSGNSTQIGQIIMMGLLLSTAGLLALSNAHAKCLTVCGRVVVSKDSERTKKDVGKGSGSGHGGILKEGSKERVEKRVRFAPSPASASTNSMEIINDEEGPRVIEGEAVTLGEEEGTRNKGMEDIKT